MLQLLLFYLRQAESEVSGGSPVVQFHSKVSKS